MIQEESAVAKLKLPENMSQMALLSRGRGPYLVMVAAVICCWMLATTTLVVEAKLAARGKYEMMATPASSSASSSSSGKNADEHRGIIDNVKMMFGGGASNRAPAHDTPASACSCRKYSLLLVTTRVGAPIRGNQIKVE